MQAFANQIAVVTGASGAIGGAVAAALTREGATVCGVGRSGERLDALVAGLDRAGGSLDVVRADLTSDDDLQRLGQHVLDTWGRLDVLVHCAGIFALGKLEEAPVETLDALYRTNVRGPFVLTQRLLPLLKKPRGQIVFVNSSSGLSARPNIGQYAAMQHAFKALADGFRLEVNVDGVRVISIYPGRTATPRIATLTASEGRPFQPELLLQPSDVASAIVSALALPWTAEVTDFSLRPMQKSY